LRAGRRLVEPATAGPAGRPLEPATAAPAVRPPELQSRTARCSFAPCRTPISGVAAVTARAAASRAERGPLISAHRGGCETAPEGTYAAYRSALAAGAEYLEFDVRMTADHQLVAYHDARLPSGQEVAATCYAELCRAAGYEVPTTSELIQLMAGRAGAHVDLKEPAAGAAVIAQALGLVAPASIVVTSRDPATVRTVKEHHPEVGAGLTIGGDAAESVRNAARWARPERWAEAVVAASADWVAVQHRLARTGVLAECRQLGLRTMVWTVTGDASLRRWLARTDVDVVVTDRPGRAAALRAAG
jgi:glycerophosphoryl diester phosphodiesterase